MYTDFSEAWRGFNQCFYSPGKTKYFAEYWITSRVDLFICLFVYLTEHCVEPKIVKNGAEWGLFWSRRSRSRFYKLGRMYWQKNWGRRYLAALFPDVVWRICVSRGRPARAAALRWHVSVCSSYFSAFPSSVCSSDWLFIDLSFGNNVKHCMSVRRLL